MQTRRCDEVARICRAGCCIFPAVVACWLALGTTCRAGGGPENVFLVVNSASWASQTVANHFRNLRQIPPGNVFYIHWDNALDNVPAETFRQRILLPILQTIDRRGLQGQIDYIVYSSDLPWSVDLQAEMQGHALPAPLTPITSATGVTYLWQLLMSHNPNVLGLRNNEYMRRAAGREVTLPTHGFRSWYGWGPQGQLLEGGGANYFLSTMLAVTSGRGTSVSESVSYLRAAAAADGAKPPGTIYYLKNDNVRSTCRAPGFDEAVADLRALGVKAAVLDGILPEHKSDVQGAMIGTADFSWASSGSTIRPGAICENLTSYGGILTEGAGQTPLTEFLRHGAAASSGTVVEPFALQDKFPVPDMHVYYARGCSLAESYYQSVFGPFQLLIVGDPLCRPWADIPRVQVPQLHDGERLHGTVELRPKVEFAAKTTHQAARCQLFVDGRRHAAVASDEPLPLDTTSLADGYHELRIVAIAQDAIESQGRQIVGIWIDNHGHSLKFDASTHDAQWDQPLTLKAEAPGMDGVVFFNNGRVIGRFNGASGEATVEPRLLGIGPVMLQAVALSRESGSEQVWAKPLQISVKPSAMLPGLAERLENRLTRGLLLKVSGGQPVPIQETHDPNWLAAAGVKPRDEFSLEAYFNAPADDMYQFQVSYNGELAVQVDNSATPRRQGGKQWNLVSARAARGRTPSPAHQRTGRHARLAADQLWRLGHV